MNELLLAGKCACIAWVYTNILTQPEMVFSSLYTYATRLAARYPITEWILKPVILCTTCVTGQMALWAYVLTICYHIEAIAVFINMAFCISAAILITQQLTKKTNR